MLIDPYDLLCFDLDGTLVDSASDIATSANHALEELGLEPLPLDDVRDRVGNGARRLIEACLEARRADPELVETGLAAFLEHYRDHLVVATRPYPGARESLEGCRRAGKVLAVLTNKPQALAEGILGELGLADVFSAVHGAGDLFPRKPDPSSLLALVERFATEPGRCLLVGDTGVDLETARRAGAAAAGVAFGFRPEEVREADHFLEDLRDLLTAP